MRTLVLIVCVLVFLVFGAFLWLLIAGADESRRRTSNKADDDHKDS